MIFSIWQEYFYRKTVNALDDQREVEGYWYEVIMGEVFLWEGLTYVDSRKVVAYVAV